MPTPATNRFQKLVDNISRLYTTARKAQVQFAWETGKQIVLVEQDGAMRAQYGTALLRELSQALTKKFGPGFSQTVLRKMRQFYLLNSIQPPAAKLDWTDHVELLPLNDDKLRRQIEEKAVKQRLNSKDIRQLVRKTREEKGEEMREPAPASAPQELLTPKRGTPYTYRLIKRPQVGLGKDDTLFLDLGFGIFKRVSVRVQSRFTENQIVESEYSSGDESFSLKTSERTAKDLFTYQATVERIIDGDTLKVRIDLGFDLEHRETLRLRGIDAPEMSTKSGEAAKAFVQTLIKKADTMTIFTSRSDKYDRYLADVFIAGESGEVYLNNLLLQNSHARRVT
ncbi:MAG: thermonuclease family protein [Candidatus Omnitrophica bacterium]|nr:thermonuclease family protein [Candidatus Omnitrophota bacterium]